MGKNLIVSRGIIKHNGVFYETGDIIEGVSLEDENRAKLLEYGQVCESEPVEEFDPGADGAAKKVQKMSKDALVALAEANNVDISSCTNNEQRATAIIAALGLK